MSKFKKVRPQRSGNLKDDFSFAKKFLLVSICLFLSLASLNFSSAIDPSGSSDEQYLELSQFEKYGTRDLPYNLNFENWPGISFVTYQIDGFFNEFSLPPLLNRKIGLWRFLQVSYFSLALPPPSLT